ncbi:MAG: hypothetical protein Q7S87_04660 [Agitococcus sp.]|nr:hypothetical protein [Agitococcus sp.]
MTYAAVAVGGMSLLGGITSSKSSKKMAKEQLALQREMFDFAKQRYTDYKTNYGDIEQKLIADAKEGVTADLGGVTSRAAADVSTQFAGAEGARLRNMQRMGINPNSGRAESTARQTGIAEATAKAGNITAAREGERVNANNQTYLRRNNAMQMGLGQMGVATNDMNSAMSGMSNTYGQMANNAANQAGQFFNVAGNVAGKYISGLGNKPPATANNGVVIKPGTNYTDNPFSLPSYQQQPYSAIRGAA